MATTYDYDEIDRLPCFSEFENIKNIPINNIYFQLDFIGLIRGDILMNLIPQQKLIFFIKKTQCMLGTNTQISNIYIEELNLLSVCEESYKKIMMVKTDDIDIDEYICVEIKNNEYLGTKLYPGFCFIKF
jgi:hypothetical protein